MQSRSSARGRRGDDPTLAGIPPSPVPPNRRVGQFSTACGSSACQFGGGAPAEGTQAQPLLALRWRVAAGSVPPRDIPRSMPEARRSAPPRTQSTGRGSLAGLQRAAGIAQISTASAHSRGGCGRRGNAEPQPDRRRTTCSGAPIHGDRSADRTAWQSGPRSIAVGASLPSCVRQDSAGLAAWPNLTRR